MLNPLRVPFFLYTFDGAFHSKRWVNNRIHLEYTKKTVTYGK